MNRIDCVANGVHFTAFEQGEGERLIVLLHGFPDDAGSMRPLMDRLAEAGYRCVAPYMRGYGPTGPAPDGRYDVGTLAEDALGLLDELGGATRYLVGHDWGAPAGYLAAAQDPTALDGLVGMAVPPRFFGGITEHPRQLLRSWYMFFFQLPWLPERVIRWRDMAFIERLWHRWSPGWTPPAERLRAVKATLQSPGSLEAALAYYRQTVRGTLRAMLAGSSVGPVDGGPLRVPGLVIAGRQDGCVGPELFEGSEAAFEGGGRLEYVSGAGHFMHLEAPDTVAETILSFFGEGRN